MNEESIFVNEPNTEMLESGQLSPGQSSVTCCWKSNEYMTLVRFPPDPHVCEQDDHSAHTKIIKYII